MKALPGGWESAEFDLIFDRLQYGLTAKASRDSKGVRFLRITDLNNGEIDWSEVPGLADGDGIERFLLADGDFVFARSGSIEKAARVRSPPPAVFASYLIRGHPSDQGLGEWLAYFVRSQGYLDQIAERAAGIGMSNVSAEKLKSVTVGVPPLAEQRRIVAKLDALTARTARARADLDRIPALAARYKQAVLAMAFSGELTADLEVSSLDLLAGTFTAEEVSGRSPAIGDLPEGWRWTSVGSLTAVSGGLTKNAKRATAPLQVPYLRVANVYADELRLNEVAMIGCTDGEFDKTRLQRGDLLIVEGNGSLEQVGRAAMWNDELEACSHQNHLIRLRTAKQLMPRYLLLWLSSPSGRVAIESVASSSSGLHTLSVSKVKGLPLPLCGLDEQKVIVGRIDRAFAEVGRLIAEAASARRLLDRLDQAVLAKAFRGELVPQDPADEPASVLLDRIRAERAAAPKAKRGRKPVAA